MISPFERDDFTDLSTGAIQCYVFKRNSYEELKKRIDYDQTVLGISAAKHTFNNTDGIKLDYVDPSNLVYSYTEDPYFEDIYYFGEIRTLPINEIVKEFPELTPKDLEELTKQGHHSSGFYNRHSSDSTDKNQVQVLYFNYKIIK